MALNFSALQAVVTQIKADTAQNATDLQGIIDKLAGISTSDPADQAIIDQAVVDLGGVKDSIEATNSKTEAAISPAPTAGA